MARRRGARRSQRARARRITARGAHVDAKLADLERRLTVRLGGMMVAGIATVSALVELL